MQWNHPLTLALSPSDGERERLCPSAEQSLFGDWSRRLPIFALSPSDGADGEREKFGSPRERSSKRACPPHRQSRSLSPSDGERVKVRGLFNGVLTVRRIFENLKLWLAVLA